MANGGEPGGSHTKLAPTWLKDLWSDHPRVVVAAIAVAGLGGIVALIWPVTDLIAAHDVGLITASTRAAALQTAREAVRTQLLTLGAGVFAAGALIYTARNFALARGALEETRRTVELTRRTVELTEQGQVTDRYTKAIEQLGSDKLDVRIGGIYALERIACDSPRDHATVMEVLAAFTRDHSHEKWRAPAAETGTPERTTRPDIQGALTVIGRRNSDNERIDLTTANLTGANLMGANLARAILTSANLASAKLTDADLTDADIGGRAVLTRANLAKAHLSGAILFHADLTDADLNDADLTGATLTDADLTGANRLRGPAPEGWEKDRDSGRLHRSSSEPSSKLQVGRCKDCACSGYRGTFQAGSRCVSCGHIYEDHLS